MTSRVTDVKKSWASVSEMVEKGNPIHFAPGGSYIEEAKGERIPLTLEGGVYVMGVEYLSGFMGQV